jgi:hypothetical protein
VPLVDGGKGVPENLVTACAFCNRRKGRSSLDAFVGPKRAAEIRELARKPLDKPLVPARVLNPPPRPPVPSYPTSANNKLHDLVRDLVNTLAYVQPVPAAQMKERAKSLGVKFFGERPGGEPPTWSE